MSDFTASRENGSRRRPKGYDKGWRPQTRTLALLEQVRGVLGEYEDYLPLTVRQIFYRLVGAHGYEKTERAYARLAESLVRARRAGRIPFGAIRDDGVSVADTAFYYGVEDFHNQTAARAMRYCRDRQDGQPRRVELWCEAAGMLHQLHRVAEEFSVPVFSAGGFASLTATRGIAARALKRNRPTVVLHVGDFDPSGESIFEAIAEDAAAFVEADRTVRTIHLEARRVALTAGQVEAHDLETAPPKASDSRSARWRGETCQLEALAPDVLAGVVRDAILGQFDFGVLRSVLKEERSERAALLGLPPGPGRGDE
jgi:hypothetical protein